MSGFELMFLQGAATAVSAAGQLSQGAAERDAMNANAAAARAEAENAAIAAAVDAEKEQERGERALGTAVNNAGASGFTIDGSALSVLGDLAGQHRFNTRELIYAGDLERRRLLQQASNYSAQGKAAWRNGVLGAVGTVMSGGYRMRQTSLDRAAAAPGKRAPAARTSPTTRRRHYTQLPGRS